ncbi:MAG: tRNA (N6-isopentenyl adenosine(37)-C2)-methylthiotransferase MiaB [Nitrospirae bacterium]|nr:tRNA (N6-isopentenyl adenosine(37)-C2)-methylthiotransferase MiaB [Nitrospirota bacterium]
MKMQEKRLAHLHTWGCQMNAHDTEKIAGILKGQGYDLTADPESAELIILNTCSIREKAQHKFYSYLGYLAHLKKRRPFIKIGVTGCIAQQEGDHMHELNKAVDFSFGSQNIMKLPDLLHSESFQAAVEDNDAIVTTDLPAQRDNGVRALVAIMYGCNNFCSYCVVPYTRGRERSRPYENIINEITSLATNGYKEVTLIGQNVNSYNGGCSFARLLRLIDNVEGIRRVRFITSHPKDFTDELILAMAELRTVCRHVHLPMQSGSSRVLALMNRRYDYETYIDKVRRLQLAIPDVCVTSDIIAGFPGESDDDHEQTINALNEIEFDGIFAFKYSKRPNTKAALMDDQVDEDVKSQRLQEILSCQDVITERKNKALEGSIIEVLVDGRQECPAAVKESETAPNTWIGRTSTNKIVNFPSNDDLQSAQFLNVRIVKAYRHTLEGEVVAGVSCSNKEPGASWSGKER